MLKPFLTACLAASLATFSGLAGAAQAADKAPIRVAQIDVLSGPLAAVGKVYQAAMRFDAQRINENGGINGHKLEIVSYDDKANPKIASVNLQKAIDDGIRFITQGSGSSVGSALLNAVERHNQRNPNDRVLFLDHDNADPSFTNERCSFWHFRFVIDADMKMKMITDWVKSQKDIHRVFLLNPDYNFGHSFSEAARRMLKEKRPDIKIVGDVYTPLGKVKDFSPYITQIKAAKADLVITGDWGQDVVLLVKAASDYGLNIPFITHGGNSPGVVTEVGKKGVDRLYLAFPFDYDYASNPELAARETRMYKQMKWDYANPPTTYMLDMLKLAIEKAGSTDTTKVAYALEGLQYDSVFGKVTMRADNHQLLMPASITTLKGDQKYGLEGTSFDFQPVARFSAQDLKMPTTCHMQRPKQ